MKLTLVTNNRQIIFAPPDIPSVIRYYDEFNDRIISIKNPKDEDVWGIVVAGSNRLLDFNHFESELRQILKCWAAFLIQSMAPATVLIYYSSLLKVTQEELIVAINSNPTEIRYFWRLLMSKDYTNFQLISIKSILNFQCRFNLGYWSSDYLEFLVTLPLLAVDKFAGIRTGEVFLSVDEEAVLVSLSNSVQLFPLFQPSEGDFYAA